MVIRMKAAFLGSVVETSSTRCMDRISGIRQKDQDQIFCGRIQLLLRKEDGVSL